MALQVTALGQAIAKVEAYCEMPLDENDGSEILTLQIFFTKGAGAYVFSVAQGVYAEREDETIHEASVMENVNNSRAFQNIRETVDLDELLKHVDGTTALLARSKAQIPLNTTQKATVQAEFQKLQSAVTAWVAEGLRKRVLTSIGLSLEALAKGSVTVSDQVKQSIPETGTVSHQANQRKD